MSSRLTIPRIIQTAIVGFGLSGRVFHAPFLAVHEGFRIHSIVSSGDEAGRHYPEARRFASFEEMLQQNNIELVVICTPNTLHFPQAEKALKAGKHVVVEKPMTTSTEQAKKLISISQETGKKIFPYHNRRWDSDFRTVKHIIERGYLGNILEYSAHFDRYNPKISRAAWRYTQQEGGGTLFDLGIHLIDQAVHLFGKPDSIFCRLYNQREGSITDDSFELKLFFPALTANLHAGVFVKEPGPRFQVHGTKGSFIKSGMDPQEEALRKGNSPGTPGFGVEPAENAGILHYEEDGKSCRQKFPTLPGNYMAFYENVYDVLTFNKQAAITPEEALLNICIIEKARESNEKKKIIDF